MNQRTRISFPSRFCISFPSRLPPSGRLGRVTRIRDSDTRISFPSLSPCSPLSASVLRPRSNSLFTFSPPPFPLR